MLDALATEAHYLTHLAPLWLALEPAERGTFWLAGAVADQAGSEGILPTSIGWPRGKGPPVLVASFQDHRSATAAGRRTVYLEHGAGQTYVTGDEPHPSYSGSPGHEGTLLFLSPSETVAGRWRDRYPEIPAMAVGCPRLDGFHAAGAVAPAAPRRPHPALSAAGPGPAALQRPRGRRSGEGGPPVVAISFHSPVRLCPETYGAFPAYSEGLRVAVAELRVLGLEVLGHGHPRIWSRLAPMWRALGVEAVGDFAEVLVRASVYACDNSSSLPEAASVGIPLVWLNAPWFRREVHHGGRYWIWPAGQVNCETAAELPGAVVAALADPPDVRAAREEMVREVYLATDGRATQRSIEAIRAAGLID